MCDREDCNMKIKMVHLRLLRTTSKPIRRTGNQSGSQGLGGGVSGPLNDSTTW